MLRRMLFDFLYILLSQFQIPRRKQVIIFTAIKIQKVIMGIVSNVFILDGQYNLLLQFSSI